MAQISQQHQDLCERPVPVLVGVGSAQGDDQAGWYVTEHLRVRCGDRVEVHLASVPLDLLDWIDQSAELHLIDACEGTESPGHLYRWDWPGTVRDSPDDSPRPSAMVPKPFALRGAGTHDFDVVSVLELAGQLERLPESVTIWGIQGQRFSARQPISSVVAAEIPRIVGTIARELIDARKITGTVAADAG